jgi:hypothetical protein
MCSSFLLKESPAEHKPARNFSNHSSVDISKCPGNSELLTTFSGSQEVFPAGLAAAGCQTRRKRRRELLQAARSRYLNSYQTSNQ